MRLRETPRVLLLLLASLACAPPTEVPGGSLAIALDGEWRTSLGNRTLPLRDPVGDLALTRDLVLPDGWDPDSRAVLRANAVGWRVRASVDGEEVGTDAGGLRPLAIDLTGALHGGVNALRLAIEGPRPDNILLGRTIPTMAAYTYRQPRAGQVEIRGEIWLEVAAARRFDDLDVTYAAGTLTARARVSGADGERVAFAVTRDGQELARFPEATVEDGVATAQVAWDGPTWTLGGSEAPFLQYLVATLPDGTRGQLRFAAREVARSGQGLALGGAPLYLAVQRHMPASTDPRGEVAALAALYGRAGMNALELHASVHADAFLAAADELGFPVVQTPRCDARRQDDGRLPADDDWAAFIAEGNARIVAADRDHPSVLLWNLEAAAEPTHPTVYVAYADAGAPAIDLRESNGYNDDSYAPMRAQMPLPAYINELAFRPTPVNGKSLVERLEPLVHEHRPWGIGVTLPHVLHTELTGDETPEGREAYIAGLSAMLARTNVSALPTGVRRGPAAVRVQVTQAGAAAPGRVVLLETPTQPAVAAATDERGVATLLLDYAGDATVRVFGLPDAAAVRLTPGRYEGGRWLPSVTTAVLTVP